jgi:nucleoside permease NupC
LHFTVSEKKLCFILQDLEIVGQLLGIKTFVNTMVAYFRFPMVEHQMSARSKMIATYALCGFSNPASIGITIASLSAMAPERRADIAAVVLRAFVAGKFIITYKAG